MQYLIKILIESDYIFKISYKDKIFMKNKGSLIKVITKYNKFLSSAETKEQIENIYNLFKDGYAKVLGEYVRDLNNTLFRYPVWYKLDYSSLEALRMSFQSLIENEFKKYMLVIYSYQNKEILNIYFERYKDKYITSCLYGEITFTDAKQDLSIEMHQAILDYKKRKNYLSH